MAQRKAVRWAITVLMVFLVVVRPNGQIESILPPLIIRLLHRNTNTDIEAS